MHGFHKDCLLDAVKLQPTSDHDKIEKIDACSKELETMKQRLQQKKKANVIKEGTGGFFDGWNLFGGGKKTQ